MQNARRMKQQERSTRTEQLERTLEIPKGIPFLGRSNTVAKPVDTAERGPRISQAKFSVPHCGKSLSRRRCRRRCRRRHRRRRRRWGGQGSAETDHKLLF